MALAGCVVGPNYRRPPAPVPATFKEAEGWRPSQPADAIDRGAWWSVFSDPELDSLERRVNISNQNVAAAEAAYRQAHALVAQQRAAYFPVFSGSGGVTYSGGGRGGAAASVNSSGAFSGGGGAQARYDASVGASWAPDLWGRVRRTVEAARANAQVSAADLASAELSAQTELATDYFELRADDAQKTLLDQIVADYQRVLQLTVNQYNVGVAARSNVVSAQSQLQNAQAQDVDIAIQRQQLEHAIAILVGVPPAELTIPPGPLATTAPVPPTGLPSALLERRPDIAAAERSMAAANAQIGVAVSAFYPDVTLSGSYGFAATNLGKLFSASSSLWSVGASIADTIFNFGGREAQVREARAAYEQRVAQYRETVLTAFQGVEDELVALRVLDQEIGIREAALASARLAEQLAINQYRAGQVDFTTVITAQNTRLAAEQSVLAAERTRLTADVALIENLGGGWSTAELPKS